MESMNEAQSRTLGQVTRTLEVDGREVRKQRVEMLGDAAMVNIETGIIGDDDTWAYVTKRGAYCFLIGPRGGIYEYGLDGKKRRRGHRTLTDIYQRRVKKQ